MSWNEFHHPDISWPVVRRRAGIELMEMLELTSLFLSRGGWAVANRSGYPNDSAFRNAVSRLRKQGLVVHRDGAETPTLELSDDGRELLPDYFFPEKMWGRKWSGIWYMLVYDVPEPDRVYRNALRRFLRQLHMGCLQQSVWVTPHDIRPQFDDLSKAASVNAFAYLFESRTVLGLSGQSVTEDAWDFDVLTEVQEQYCQVAEQNMNKLSSGGHSPEELTALLRMSQDAYHSAMINDPLLPRSLHPKRYLGEKVYSLHMQLIESLCHQLNGCVIQLDGRLDG